MVTTIPNTAGVISNEALDGLSMGSLQALQLRIVQRLHAKLTEPTAYHEFARHNQATAADWGTTWITERPDSSEAVDEQAIPTEASHQPAGHGPQQPAPIPPEEYFNTLPGMVDNMVTARRVQDAMVATLTGLADRAYDLDRDHMLGIPAHINLFKNGKRWLADRFQIDSRQMGKFYARAELIAAEPTTIAGVGRDPLLPQMARAYAAGTIPSENMDRMSQIAKRFYDFYHAVGLTKENATEILQTMDPVFTGAAQRMTSQQLAEEATSWLNQIAHIVDPDGPSPDERLTKVNNSLHTRIVGGKLHINIVTDTVNLELIEALVLAGLNYRANQEKFRQDPSHQDEEPATPAAPNAQSPSEQTGSSSDSVATESDLDPEVIEVPGIDAKSSDDLDPSDSADSARHGESFEGLDLGYPTLNDEQGSAEERLKSFHQRMDDAVDDPETFVETKDGVAVPREDLRKLDPRSRAEKAHDVFMTMLKAQGKRSPGADGMPQYKRAPAILWTVMDYETLIQMQRDRLEPHYQLDDRHKRPPSAVEMGPPATLDPLQAVVDEHIPPDGPDPETIFGADPLLHLRWPSVTDDHEPPDDDAAFPPQGTARGRGHPYVSHRFQTGSVSPGAVLQDLCDAKIIPAIFNQAGVPLFLGRGKRVFSEDQILAAGMRGGCRGPGCRVPPVWTQGHHAHTWLQNGGTNTTNLILLCNACHTRVHQGVWTPTWDKDEQLYWIPAKWLDPTQTPVRNTYWDT